MRHNTKSKLASKLDNPIASSTPYSSHRLPKIISSSKSIFNPYITKSRSTSLSSLTNTFSSLHLPSRYVSIMVMTICPSINLKVFHYPFVLHTQPMLLNPILCIILIYLLFPSHFIPLVIILPNFMIRSPIDMVYYSTSLGE